MNIEHEENIYSSEYQKEFNKTWYHPYLYGEEIVGDFLSYDELEDLAYEYYFRFIPFFSSQNEGSIQASIKIEISNRLKKKLGLTYLFERKIKLNHVYFSKNPLHLPYTIFHEMAHIWLYDCHLDPSHTWRFYNKMQEFSVCMLPVDPKVHIHSRVAPEAKNVYCCPKCDNRWYRQKVLSHPIYCGHCFDQTGEKYFAEQRKKENITS